MDQSAHADYTGAKAINDKWAKTGKTSTRDYLYSLGKSKGMSQSDIDNLIAQNKQINRSGGEWYNMEKEWVNTLGGKPPKKVSVKIESVYLGSSLRPNSFKINTKLKANVR